MRSMTGEEWMVASQLYAFLGNSLLSPMSRTESVGLDPAFWRELGGRFGRVVGVLGRARVCRCRPLRGGAARVSRVH